MPHLSKCLGKGKIPELMVKGRTIGQKMKFSIKDSYQ